MLSLQSFLQKGMSWGHVGLNYNLKDLRGGLNVTRKEAWSFYRTISGVRLCWELEEPEDLKDLTDLKGSRLFLRFLSREGRGVCIGWEKLKP